MIGRKMIIGTKNTKDIVVIKNVEYTNNAGEFQIEARSTVTNKIITLIMTAENVKQCLIA